MSHRISQVNELILHQLAPLLLTEVDFPKGCLVTITFVEVSKDLRHAKVGISSMPAEYTKGVMEILRRNAGRLQLELNKKLSLKPLPRLSFTVDATEAKAAEIEDLINRAMADIAPDGQPSNE